MPEEETGNLNPDWVEWLMGYKIGWTRLTSSGVASASRRSRASRPTSRTARTASER